MFHRVKSEGQDAAPEEIAETQEEKSINESAEEQEVENHQSKPSEERAVDMKDDQVDTQETQEEKVSSYQRPAAAQTAPGARPAVSPYPGASSYAAAPAGYGAARSETPSANASSDRRLTIGAGITMSGEIESCDYLLVEGTVEAALKGANVLEIAESGTFYGTVEIDEANIAGRFEGDITVHGRLTISASGTVTGSIIYKELEIEAGAVIDGKLTPLSALSAASSNDKPSSAPAKKKTAPKTSKAKADTPAEPANSDDGLFSRATAAAE